MKAGEEMTDEEKEAYREKLLDLIMKYCRIDYDDDKDVVELMLDVTMQEFSDLIPNFNSCDMTQRQKLLMCVSVKELYDNRDKYAKDEKKMQNAVSSMLLKEIYGGAAL